MKRVPSDNIQLSDLFIGKTVCVLSRQLTVKSYADTNTRNKFQTNHQTLNVLFNTLNPSNNTASIEALSDLLKFLSNDKDSMFLINKLKSINVENEILKELSETLQYVYLYIT